MHLNAKPLYPNDIRSLDEVQKRIEELIRFFTTKKKYKQAGSCRMQELACRLALF